MKKLLISLLLGLLFNSAVHAQQTVVTERHGLIPDLASAACAIIALPLATPQSKAS